MNIYLRNLLFILLIVGSNPALSQEDEEIRYYDVELIIFENQSQDTESTEVWKNSGVLQVPEDSITLGRPLSVKLAPEYNPKQSFKLLAAEDLLLQEEMASLKGTEQYKVLLHTGWRQPGMPKDKAFSVNFKHAIAEITDDENSNAGIAGPAEQASTAQAATAEPTNTIGNLQGVIKIVLSRYLHTDVELVYKKKADTDLVNRFDADYLENRAGKSNVYYLKQNRRMRSKELHYIDHPVIGVLLKITPSKNG